MKKSVVLVGDDLRDKLTGTILGRGSFESSFVSEDEEAFQLLLREKVHLFVIHDRGPDMAKHFLKRLERAYPSASFPALVLYNDVPGTYPRIVRETLPVDFDAYEFNRVVASLAGLPTRRSRRLLIRVGIRLGTSGESSFVANTLNLSGVGMLIECNRALPIGSLYEVQFVGVASDRIPKLEVRIVRQVKRPRRDSPMHQYAGTFEGIAQVFMERLIRDVFFVDDDSPV